MQAWGGDAFIRMFPALGKMGCKLGWVDLPEKIPKLIKTLNCQGILGLILDSMEIRINAAQKTLKPKIEGEFFSNGL
jgi:hypothetical protein